MENYEIWSKKQASKKPEKVRKDFWEVRNCRFQVTFIKNQAMISEILKNVKNTKIWIFMKNLKNREK